MNLARIGYIEGLTYLLLLFIAFPLKYWFGLQWVLPILLALFISALFGYIALLVWALRKKLIPKWAFMFGMVGSVLPFGPFVFDQVVLEPKRLNESPTTKP